jgi:lipopolysaccharide transport system ATP-binding protein
MSEVAIKVENVSKTFKIPHEKISTMRGAFVGAFRKKTYEKFKALDNVSFEVKKGEFFGIIGRNGSGKSTLLKILAGIYQSDNGKIQINGRISPFLELGIGFNSELSGRDNIYLNATILGLSRKQIEQKFNEIVAFSELERFIDQKVKNYSSGMQVRLAFSVAIHANRDVLLMDEVLAVGDVNFQSKCMEEFNKYRDMGKTVVLVTHDIGTVQRHCDRVMLIRNGNIEMIGNPQEVGNKYVYQNMSDEEKRILDEEKRQKIKVEKEAKQLNREQKKYEQKHQAEEEKIKRLEKIKEAEEKRNKVAEITEVEFFGKDGQRKNVFETGDDISVRVYFKIHKMKDKFNFGIAIYNQENNYIFGINTIFDKINTEKYIKDGYFQVDYKNIPLIGNSYYILANIVRDNFNSFYDLLPKSQYFKVINTRNKNEGIVDLDYTWK